MLYPGMFGTHASGLRVWNADEVDFFLLAKLISRVALHCASVRVVLYRDVFSQDDEVAFLRVSADWKGSHAKRANGAKKVYSEERERAEWVLQILFFQLNTRYDMTLLLRG